MVAVSEAIQEMCDCHIPTNHIQEGQFLCMDTEPNEVLFRARVYRTQEHSSQALVRSLQEWRAGAQTVVVASTRLQVDTFCQTKINSFSDPNCEEEPSSDNGGLSVTVYIIIGVAVAMLVAIVVIVLCLGLICRCSRLARKR